MEPLRIFIGYDPAEPVAYHVCSQSIIRHSTVPVSIHPLNLDNFVGLYEETHKDGNLVKEGYEPSNQFIYSRYLTPWLSGFEGWSLFIDGDMIVTGDIKEIFEHRDPLCAVQVVKHEYETKMTTKYLGQKNENYPMKNWSSVMLFHNQYCKALTPEFVMQATGEELHRFYWCTDSQVGSLPPEWNFLEIEYEPYPKGELPKLIHYTLGTPCWEEFSKSAYANEWHKELLLAMSAYRETPVEMVLRSNQLLVDEESAEKSAA